MNRRAAVAVALFAALLVMGGADARKVWKTDIDQIGGTVTNGRVVEVHGLVTNQKQKCVENRRVQVGDPDGNLYGETTTGPAGPDFGKRAASSFTVTGDAPPGDYAVFAPRVKVGRLRCGAALFGSTIK